MKALLSLALAMASLGTLAAPACAEGLGDYVAEVRLLRDGVVVGQVSLPLGPDGTFRSYAENTRDYRQSVSFDGAGVLKK